MKSSTRFGMVLLTVAVLSAAGAFAGVPKQANSPSSTAREIGTSWLERLAEKMVPQQKFNEAAGFFGPVTKKYLPVWEKLCREYPAAEDKRAVVRKYIPQVDAALADAKAMKIPPKYEAKKAEYLKMFEAFVLAAKLYAKFGE